MELDVAHLAQAALGGQVHLHPGPATFSWVEDHEREGERQVFTLVSRGEEDRDRADSDFDSLVEYSGLGADNDCIDTDGGDVSASSASDNSSCCCRVCGEPLSTAKSAVRHMLSAHVGRHGAAVCTLCDTKLCHGHSLRKHVKAVHFRLDDFECPHCRKFIQQRSHLNRHIASMHPGKPLLGGDDPVFRCGDCSARFLDADGRDRHAAAAHGSHHSKENASPVAKRRRRSAHAPDAGRQQQQQQQEQYLRQYRCGLCSKTMWSSMHLKAHLYDHTNERPVGAAAGPACDYCGEGRFPSNKKLLSHVESKHAFQCADCPRHFASRTDLAKHFDLAHLRKEVACCKKCGRCFASAEQLMEHTRERHGSLSSSSFLASGASPLRETSSQAPPPPPVFSSSSPSATKVIASPSKTETEKRGPPSVVVLPSQVVLPTGASPSTCEYCPSSSPSFRTQAELDAHVQESHPYKCFLCKKMVKLTTSMRKHFRIKHPDVRPHFCRDCTRVFRGPKEVAGHKKTCWKNRPRDPVTNNLLESSSSQQTCSDGDALDGEETEFPLCTYLSPDETVEIISSDVVGGDILAEDEDEDEEVDVEEDEDERRQDESPPASSDEEEVLKCKHCDEEYYEEAELADHVAESHPFDCPVCRRPYKGTDSLRKHCRLRHDNLAVFPCKICVIVFTDASNRDRHFDRLHGGKAKRKSDAVQIHSTPQDNGSKSSQGNVGGQLQCPKCPKSYSVGDSVRKHAKLVHDMAVFTCTFCKVTFSDVRDKRAHLATKSHALAAAAAGKSPDNDCGNVPSPRSVPASVASPRSLLLKRPSLEKETPPPSSPSRPLPENDAPAGNAPVSPISDGPKKLALFRTQEFISGSVYHCHFCPKSYDLGSSCRKHAKRVHGELLVICRLCFTTFRSFDARERHMGRDHSGGEPAATGGNPADAVAQAEPADPTSQCQVCQAVVPSLEALEVHLAEAHPHKCPLCTRRYKLLKGLRQHFKERHPRAALHPCPSCPASFAAEAQLGRHRREQCRKSKEESPEFHGFADCTAEVRRVEALRQFREQLDSGII